MTYSCKQHIIDVQTLTSSQQQKALLCLFYWMFCDHLSARYWLSWVDEDDDEVGLKEKPENTRYS